MSVLSAPASSFGLALGRFNSDDALDIAVGKSDFSEPGVTIYHNDGSGSFTAGPRYVEAGIAGDLAVADFNNDGRPDLVTSKAVLMLANSTGSFNVTDAFQLNPSTDLVVAGDLDNDGEADVVTTERQSGQALVQLAFGDAAPEDLGSYPAGDLPRSLAIADVNLDGLADVAVGNYGSSDVSILLNTGDGTLSDAVHYPAGGRVSSVAVGDFNADGVPDLLASGGSSESVNVLLGDGAGAVSMPVDTFANAPVSLVGAGDFNGDGLDDVVYTIGSDSVIVREGIGDGSFTIGFATDMPGNVTRFVIEDLSGDGVPDIAATSHNTSSIGVMFCNGDGTFQDVFQVPLGVVPIGITAADMNGDDVIDLITANRDDMSIAILHGLGDGDFDAPVIRAIDGDPTDVQAADVNRDGSPDLVLVYDGPSGLALLLSDGAGGFLPASPYAPGVRVDTARAADLNADGAPDLCGLSSTEGVWTLMISCDPCVADLSEPFGVLDFSDVTAFLVAFATCDPPRGYRAASWRVRFLRCHRLPGRLWRGVPVAPFIP
ncbi:MAG: FG-GAP repeat domain-containing protein [Phycisphaerales bacterium JB059]